MLVQDRWVQGRCAQARYEHDHCRPYVKDRPGHDNDSDGICNSHAKDRDGDGVRNKHD